MPLLSLLFNNSSEWANGKFSLMQTKFIHSCPFTRLHTITALPAVEPPLFDSSLLEGKGSKHIFNLDKLGKISTSR